MGRAVGRIVALPACAAMFVLAPGDRAVSQDDLDIIQAGVKPQLNIDLSRRIRQTVRDIGGQRWASANLLVPSRFSLALPGDFQMQSFAVDLLDGAPANPVAEQPDAGWNFWIDGSTGYLEDTNPARAYDGDQWVISAGVDTEITDALTLGMIYAHSRSDVTTAFIPGKSTTETNGVGPYMALFLTDTLVFTGSFLYSWTENGSKNTADGGASSYDSQKWAVNGTLTSYHVVGNWLLAPTIGVSYDDERDEAYTDNYGFSYAEANTQTGILAFGGTASYPFDLGNGFVIQPGLGVEGEWTFLSSTTATGVASSDAEGFDANVTASADLIFNDSVSLYFSVTASGLVKPDYNSVIGGGRLTISF